VQKLKNISKYLAKIVIAQTLKVKSLNLGSISPNFIRQAKRLRHTAYGVKFTVHFHQQFPLNLRSQICQIYKPKICRICKPFEQKSRKNMDEINPRCQKISSFWVNKS
jgi:hypothetical protein